MQPGPVQFSPESITRSHEGESATSRATEARLLVPIRVLYTLDASSQFLLARHRQKVQVVPIFEEDTRRSCTAGSRSTDHAVAKPRFAKVSLKRCLGAVCISSPELLAHGSRDYSVYVLDPLESGPIEGKPVVPNSKWLPPDPLRSGTSLSSCPREGISVGMGLMSWCLSDDRTTTSGIEDCDEGDVVGKLVKDRGADALEVIMFLRETAPQTQRQHALSLSVRGLGASMTAPQSGHPSANSTRQSYPMLSDPKRCVPPDLPNVTQTPTTNMKEIVLESDDPSTLQVASSSAPDPPPSASSSQSSTESPTAFRIGRPQGAITHPEKRARRLAIQSHKETLERMENIAKMQRGEEYDKTLIIISDHDRPKITDDEISRQRKLLEELESRPLIVDRSSCLWTTKPLPKRASTRTSIVPLSQKDHGRRKPRTAPATNATSSSGSGINESNGTDKKHIPDLFTSGAPGNKHGTELLLSLLTSVLGEVDGPSAGHPATSHGPGKGKEREKPLSAEGALALALNDLLPLLSNAATHKGALSPSRATGHSASVPNTIYGPDGASTPRWSEGHALRSQEHSSLTPSHRLFKTAEDTFHTKPQPGSNWPYDRHWTKDKTVAPKTDHPKVREDAHPVPGGGWARGRNLVPRTATSTNTILTPSDGQAGRITKDTGKRASTTDTVAQPNKENMPPAASGRGLKRTLSTTTDAKEKGDGTSSKIGTKKRKQEISPAFRTDAARSTDAKRMVMSSEGNKTCTFGAIGFAAAASSPVRSTVSTMVARGLPVIAMSEPGYLTTPLPMITTSTSPDHTEPPRTPPKCGKSLDDDAGGSLFTPCTPESTSQLRGSVYPLGDGRLFSPSPVKANSRGSHVSRAASLATVSGRNIECSEPVRTGWDLPPSSPPPPTSPISPHADIGSEQEDQAALESATRLQSELDVGMGVCGTDDKFEDRGTTIRCDGISSPVASLEKGPLDELSSAFYAPVSSSDFNPIFDADFDFGELGQAQGEQGSSMGIELDIEELWSSLGPVIAQAQTDSNVAANNQVSSQVEVDFDHFDLGNDQRHVAAEVQGGVDAAKLAEDLKALFGGCVV